MSCNCNAANPAPYNAVNLKLGTGPTNKALNVYVKTASGREDVFTATSDSDGLITLATPQLRLSTPYEVTIADSADISQERITWTIGGTEVSCITLLLNQQFKNYALWAPATFEITLS